MNGQVTNVTDTSKHCKITARNEKYTVTALSIYAYKIINNVNIKFILSNHKIYPLKVIHISQT